jgi:hypothetical protein
MKTLDSVIQGGYHQAQIRRLADGRSPDAELSRLEALVHYVAPRWSSTPAAQAVQLLRRSFA